MRTISISFPLPLLPTLLLAALIPASTPNSISYQPAVQIIQANCGNGQCNNPASAQPQSVSIQYTSPTSPTSPNSNPIPNSLAISPVCPSTHTSSCDRIGYPSWCCADSQHCVNDDGGGIACCPIGDVCRGRIDYGTVWATAALGVGGGGGASPTVAQGGGSVETVIAEPGLQSGNDGPVAIQQSGGFRSLGVSGVVIFEIALHLVIVTVFALWYGA